MSVVRDPVVIKLTTLQHQLKQTSLTKQAQSGFGAASLAPDEADWSTLSI